ncbi:MAG: hypothetical protein QOG72_1694 [Sphingomonadales bacterium]|nr:hypothetical protein [Sphingomonadales bacterium]
MKPVLPLFACLAMSSSGIALAQAQGQPDFIDAAKIVAAQNNISVGEAVRRIKLQERILDLQTKLLKEERGNFAGIAIAADSRGQRVKIKFREPRGKTAETVVADTELRAESDVETAARSVDDLLAAQGDLLSRMKGYKGGGVAVGINFQTNGLNVKTKDVAAARAHIAAAGFDASVPLNFVAGDPTIVDESRVTGGRDVEGCQTGFVVANYSGLRGVSSAEHCGTGLIDLNTNESVGDHQAGLLNNSQGTDISWHRSAAHTYVNYIYTPNGEVRITSSKGISLMPYGTQACLSRTQYNPSLGSPAVSCGIVYNANYTFTDPSTGLTSGPWVAVSPQGSTVLSQPGDSGGPWFSGNAAMGIHKGKDPTGYSLFTPVERFSKISVLVATN